MLTTLLCQLHTWFWAAHTFHELRTLMTGDVYCFSSINIILFSAEFVYLLIDTPACWCELRGLTAAPGTAPPDVRRKQSAGQKNPSRSPEARYKITQLKTRNCQEYAISNKEMHTHKPGWHLPLPQWAHWQPHPVRCSRPSGEECCHRRSPHWPLQVEKTYVYVWHVCQAFLHFIDLGKFYIDWGRSKRSWHIKYTASTCICVCVCVCVCVLTWTPRLSR